MVSVINTLTFYNDRQEYFTKISAEWRVYENTRKAKRYYRRFYVQHDGTHCYEWSNTACIISIFK